MKHRWTSFFWLYRIFLRRLYVFGTIGRICTYIIHIPRIVGSGGVRKWWTDPPNGHVMRKTMINHQKVFFFPKTCLDKPAQTSPAIGIDRHWKTTFLYDSLRELYFLSDVVFAVFLHIFTIPIIPEMGLILLPTPSGSAQVEVH